MATAAITKPKRAAKAKADAPLALTREWKHYGLRTASADGTSYGSFQWPLTGLVECPDWSPINQCGNGLHACLNGEGNGGLLDWSSSARWQLVGFDEYVDLGGKVKFPRCEVATGTRKQTTDAIKKLTGGACHGGSFSAGDSGTATAGDSGTATAGDSGTATAGDRGTATAGDRGTATAGDRGTATAGDRGTATAGDRGIVCVKWWDGDRYRMAVGYPGENGIKAETAYRVSNGMLVECAS